MERQFEDLGIDAITGLELMKLCNLTPDDFIDDGRFNRFKDVISYFKNIPDKSFIINKITIGKNVDKLDHVWGYVELLKQKNELKEHTEDIMKQVENLARFGVDNPILTDKLAQQSAEVTSKIKQVDTQMEAYER